VLAGIRIRARADALATRGARSHTTRDPKVRRRYAGDPLAYFADILGWTLTPQQEYALGVIERERRVLLPSANNVGKTFILAGYGVYVMDAVAALPDDESGFEEQGARILLPGPDHDTVFETIYAEMLTHAARAETRGHRMPGERSERSVLWRVRPKWHVEVLTPPTKVGQAVAHTASGRHHRNQIALVEEGQGVGEPLWRGAEGMCSSAGNKIISSFNPTEALGPAFQRSRAGSYITVHLDAFEHPNIRQRVGVIPDAVDCRVIDDRVRTDCTDRGAAPATPVELEQGDFVYALPPRLDTPERGGRTDGVPGHPDGEPRVYRPTGAFMAQVRGQYPSSNDAGLFSAGAWDAAVARWREEQDPPTAPDSVGVDVAREGKDDTRSAPRWGDGASALLRAYATAQPVGAVAVADLQRMRRARIGALTLFPKGDGVDTGDRIARQHPDSPLVIDDGGVGSSPLDYLGRVIGRQVLGVSFGGSAFPSLPGEPVCENMRTQLYVRAAMLVARGLCDVPPSARLREEVLAHRLEYTTRTVERINAIKGRTEKVRVTSVRLVEKKEVRKLIGRSPDESDAFVLALYEDDTPAPPRRRPSYGSSSQFTPG
jgi:hypothetical protein